MSNEALFTHIYPVEAGDFVRAGEASTQVKNLLKKLGMPSDLVRRVAVAIYEAEMNLVIHSLGGELELDITPENILIISRDVGPGIPDVDLAMREGYSTAPDSVRQLGFGAGMGLPNIRRCCDEFSIASEVGTGTCINMQMNIDQMTR